MRRIFFGAFLAGLALVALVVGLWPMPEHERVRSLIEVQPDGGRAERFVIRWPEDRLELPAGAGIDEPLRRALAEGTLVLEDPAAGRISGELFRLRDREGSVIGVAARLAASAAGARSAGSEWLLVIPSRGSLAMTQAGSPAGGLRRTGTVVWGTDEFAGLRGRYSESWEGAAEPAGAGSVLLDTVLERSGG